MRSDFTTEDDSNPDPEVDRLRDGIGRDPRAVIACVIDHLECVVTQLEALMRAPDGPYQPPTQ
jgi:hypothetical protein